MNKETSAFWAQRANLIRRGFRNKPQIREVKCEADNCNEPATPEDQWLLADGRRIELCAGHRLEYERQARLNEALQEAGEEGR